MPITSARSESQNRPREEATGNLIKYLYLRYTPPLSLSRFLSVILVNFPIAIQILPRRASVFFSNVAFIRGHNVSPSEGELS